MNHKADPSFWFHYRQLPPEVRAVADKNFQLLQENPRHGSLQLKKVGTDLYSVRVGLGHRALAFNFGAHLVWFWIGTHDEYDRLVASL